ncbi:MAG: hypothetical protein ABI651_01665 [Verrucomicrobiota bacterium]
MHEHLPGGEILEQGLRDLEAGVRSVSALLVMTAAPRLARRGIQIPKNLSFSPLPEHELYDVLVAEQGPEAYRFYRSLLRRLVSLENALDIRSESQGTAIKTT